MWHNEDIINYIIPHTAGKTCWYAWSPVVWEFLVQIFVSWLLKSPFLKVVNFQSTGQSMATARSPADSNNMQGSVVAIFVVQMDNNAAHARLLMTNEKCGWHMLISKCKWKLIYSHLQYILFHHQCIYNSLPSTVMPVPPTHTSLIQMSNTSEVAWCMCCHNGQTSVVLCCTIFHAHTSHFF
jgi:hypothetical protein